jgi:hypothetical protein
MEAGMTTLGNTARKEQKEKAVAPPEPNVDSSRQCAQRVNSVPAAFPGALSDTPGAHAASQARVRLATMAVWADGVLSGSSLLHADAPSLHHTWARHAAAARRWQVPVLRYPRYAYGAVHTSGAAAAYSLLWALSSPAGGFLALALLVYVLFFMH